MRDVDIRAALRAEMFERHKGDADTVLVEELGLRQGLVRVDLAVVNGALHGFEIKSPADTLRRLPLQVEVYSQVLDFATLVLVERHQDAAMEIVPKWWQVLAASETPAGIELAELRGGWRNPAIDKRALVELLWHQESLELLRPRGLDRGLSNKPRARAWDRLCECLSTEEVAAAVRQRLKGRSRAQAGL